MSDPTVGTPNPRRITISINAAGYGSVEVDGQHIPHLRGFDVKARAGSLTEVSLHAAAPSVELDGDGFVGIDARLRETLESLGWTPPES